MKFNIISNDSMLKNYILLYIASIQDGGCIAPTNNGYFFMKWQGKIHNNITENKTIEYKACKGSCENDEVQARLYINIKMYCDTNYYGYKCEHKCNISDDSLDYHCNENGTKTSNEGINCEEKEDECKSSPCKKNSTCDQHNGYKCRCKNESYGINCEHITPDNTKNPTHSTVTTDKSTMIVRIKFIQIIFK